MCIQDNIPSCTIFCPISFAQKCGLIYYIFELKGRFFYIIVLVVKAYIWGVLKAMPIKIGQPKYHILKKNIDFWDAPTTNKYRFSIAYTYSSSLTLDSHN